MRTGQKKTRNLGTIYLLFNGESIDFVKIEKGEKKNDEKD